jgi:hypothetical protein
VDWIEVKNGWSLTVNAVEWSVLATMLDTCPGGSPTIGLPSVAVPDCDASYATVCLPPPPPDLNCDDVPHRDIAVIGGDPHRFDGDGNGVGCES